jgi:cysteine-rich secretory family protein
MGKDRRMVRTARRSPIPLASLVAVLAALTVAAGLLLVSAAGPAIAQSAGAATVERRMVELTNQARAAAGARPLQVDARLTTTSRDWSCRMAAARNLRHDPNFAASGAKGENVAWRSSGGPDVGLQLHNQFMSSPGHRANLLNPRWTRLGIGYCAGNGHWVTERFSDGPVTPAAAPPSGGTRPAPAPAPVAAPARPSAPAPADAPRATDGDGVAADGAEAGADSDAAASGDAAASAPDGAEADAPAGAGDAAAGDAAVAVPESVEADELPFTGSGSGQLALFAAALLFAGGWLLRRTTLGGRHARSRRGR